MKRFLIGVLILVLIVVIPLSTNLMAKKKGKVEICHVTYNFKDTLFFGHIISVSERAVKAHIQHGDRPMVKALRLTKKARIDYEKLYGIDLQQSPGTFHWKPG
ncbi:hypothetical protein ACFLT9_00290 [Acidobacteriota bacterium]